jgi:putative SOS response-associated peptidase YedK
MCGRYAITKAAKKTKNIVQNNEGVDDTDNFNAHPTQLLPVIKKDNDSLTLTNYHWGLVPKWSEKMQDFRPLNNARLETLMEKRTFSGLVAKQRCVVPADGYYEWRKNDEGKKFPYFIKREHNETLFFTGLYQKNNNIEFSVITTAAQGELTNIHQRMPVILKEEEIQNYLNTPDPMVFLNSHQNPELVFYEVSRDVNNPSNNNAGLLDPA